MSNLSFKWGFDPLYEPDQEVWWIEERIKHGFVRGISYEKSGFDGILRNHVVYFVELIIDKGTGRVFEVPEGRLFDSREKALAYIENN